MEIRPATPDDVPAVLPMVAQIAALHEQWDPAKYGFLPDPASRYRDWLRHNANEERAVFLVAESEPGKLVGFIVATVEREIPIYRLKEFGFVHDLWVEPDYRHEGIGRQLAMRTIERFREIGVQQIRLDTAARNEPARKLFLSCGFRTSVVEMLLDLKLKRREA